MRVEPQAGVSSPHPRLQECLGSMLRAFERSVGFAEGVVMAFDPDVLLPTAFAVTVERGFDDALVACRNEQLDDDFLKFRDLAAGPVRVGAAGRDCDPRARTSRRWREILDVRGHGHELRAALVDGSGQCWGALNFMRDAGHPFTDRDLRVVQAGIGCGAAAIARSMVAAGTAEGNGLEPGSVWLDENGSVVFASPAAQQWLELLDAYSHAGFARALLAGLAMRAARGAAHDGPGGPGRDAPEASGAIAVRVRTAGGRWVRARAEPITAGAGDTTSSIWLALVRAQGRPVANRAHRRPADSASTALNFKTALLPSGHIFRLLARQTRARYPRRA